MISLVPTSIAAELAVRLVTHVVDSDVQTFLQETSVLFLNNFKESNRRRAGLARFLYEQKRGQTRAGGHGRPCLPAFDQTLGYGVVVVSDTDHGSFIRTIRYAGSNPCRPTPRTPSMRCNSRRQPGDDRRHLRL